MPNTLINELTPYRIEAGSTITLNDGTTTFELKNLEPGTVRLKPGGVEMLTWTDRGAQQTPVIGDDQLTSVEMSLKLAKTASSQRFVAMSQTQQDATSLVAKLYTLVIKMLDSRGAATGLSWTLANCYFAEPVEVQSGAKFDIVRLKLMSKTPTVTEATF